MKNKTLLQISVGLLNEFYNSKQHKYRINDDKTVDEFLEGEMNYNINVQDHLNYALEECQQNNNKIWEELFTQWIQCLIYSTERGNYEK